MRKLMLIPAALLVAAASNFAFAQDGGQDGHGWQDHHGQQHGHHHGHRHGGAFAHELHQLNLTDAQKANIKNLVKASFKQARPQFEALRQQRQAFEALTPDSPNYNAAASSLAQAAANAVAARVQNGAALKQQIYGQLTDTQKQKLAALEAADQAIRQARIAKWKLEHQDGDHGGDHHDHDGGE